MGKSEYLREEAVGLGLCEQWRGEWLDGQGDDELIDKFKTGIDFCILHDWPSVEYIKGHFGKDVLHGHGVFVDDNLGNGVAGHPTVGGGSVVLLGRCTGRLRFGGFDVATVYVRHECDVEIVVSDFARVDVRVYEHGNATVVGNSVSCVRCYVYDDGSVIGSGDVSVMRRGNFKDLRDGEE